MLRGKYMNTFDPELQIAIDGEVNRQNHNIELIASENFVSPAVRAAQGSVLTNKYSEGYPGKRYYGGNEYIDMVENLAIDRAKKLFNAEYANVQPHSGSQANYAAYMAFLQPGDRVLGMDLDAGGHLTHGSPVNFSGKIYEFQNYVLNPETETLDYDLIAKQAEEFKPKMIVAGASAYSRFIDFAKFREIADSVGAYLMVDMAHIAGLIAAGVHPDPVPYADVITSTTHKTLRGPRGGLILAKEEFGKKLNSAVFPGSQGGPLDHVIAGKAQAFFEDLQPEFKTYAEQILKNSKAMVEVFNQTDNIRVVSGGTDNHLFTIDLTKTALNGKEAQNLLDSVSITTNREALPNEKLSPFVTSGVRIGTPAITTKGMKEEESRLIAQLIIETINNYDKPEVISDIKTRVENLALQFPFA
ncbi:MAG: serine hydroxymethyltransferase [Lactobacillaceae bacterium]|jgi:glycine hydroxymethyltransferase|nr:serine hydroxymethyltransferase [Lactobacillaceae bacterium]